VVNKYILLNAFSNFGGESVESVIGACTSRGSSTTIDDDDDDDDDDDGTKVIPSLIVIISLEFILTL
jgi:hypothetical protein